MSYRKYITLLLLLLSVSGRAQYLLGLHAGINELLQNQRVAHVSYEGKTFVGYIYPAVTATLLADNPGRINFGLSAQYLQRSFYFESYTYNPPQENFFTNEHDSRWLYTGLMGDVALDKKKYLHFAVIPSFGFLLSGEETYYNGAYFAQGSSPFPKDSLHTDSKHIARTDFRLGTQLRVQVPAGKRVYVSAALQSNFGFRSINDLHRINPADLLFSFGVFYAFGKRYRTAMPGSAIQ